MLTPKFSCQALPNPTYVLGSCQSPAAHASSVSNHTSKPYPCSNVSVCCPALDVVSNHMAAAPAEASATGVAGSPYASRSFPDYAPEDFHHLPGNVQANCAVVDYLNR